MSEEKEQSTSVQVALRVRPMSHRELEGGASPCVSVVGPDQIRIGEKSFSFDHVFDGDVTQEDVYSQCVEPLVFKFLEGYNATIFAYGQTGAGKTYTMGTAHIEHEIEDHVGLIPRVCHQLFQLLKSKRNHEGDSPTFTVRCSFLEIHNEHLNDLLLEEPNQQKPISIRPAAGGQNRVYGVEERDVMSSIEMINCLEQGLQHRLTASTRMSAMSSRSHAVFTIFLEQQKSTRHPDGSITPDILVSRFQFLDLAGSEKLSRAQTVGEHMRETMNINRGNHVLVQVIAALSDLSRQGKFIPYRESKLTFLLQDSLAGNAHTLMLACVSPADIYLDETFSTLRCGTRARLINVQPSIHHDPNARLEILLERIGRVEEILMQQQEPVVSPKQDDMDSTDSSHSTMQPTLATPKVISDTLDILRAACLCGDMAIVDRILTLPHINAASLASHSLPIAIAHGHMAIIDRLLQVPGLDLSPPHSRAISLAASRGHLALIDRLALHTPALNFASLDNEPLRYAASSGQVAVVDRLLQMPGVDATAKDNEAIRLACTHGHIAVVDRLLQVPGVDATLGMQAAAAAGQLAVVDRLLQVPAAAGGDDLADYHLALEVAAAKGYLAVVDRLLQVVGVDAAANENAPLCGAVAHHGIAVGHRLLTALRHAAACGDTAMVRRLLQVPGVDATAQNNDAFHQACQHGHVAIAELLLRDERVVQGLGLSPHIAHHPATRCAVAIAECVRRAKQSFRWKLVRAFRMAYACVRGEMYEGMAEEVCQWVCPAPVAIQAVHIQRGLYRQVQRLRACSHV